MNKTYLLLAAILILALLVACAPMESKKQDTTAKDKKTQDEATKDDTQKIDEKTIEPKQEQTQTTQPKTEQKETTTKTTAETKQETQTPADLPEKVKELVNKAKTKLTSVSYLYGGPENDGRFLDTYHIRGKKTKIKLYEDNYYVHEDYFDTVYLDTAQKTATARCEHKRRCISANTDNTKKIFGVNYDDYRRKTPMEWLNELKTAEIVGPEIMEKRSTLKVKSEQNNKITEMWLDESYGIPVQVEITYPDEKTEMYQFTNLQFNTLKEEDVTPAFTEPLDQGNQTS